MADFPSQQLRPAKEEVDEQLDRFFSELVADPGMGLVSAEEADRIRPTERRYMEDLQEYVGRGGKRLRPVSLYWAYRAAGGERSMEELSPAHLSVELFHNGTLIHDDFIDQDPARRGGESLHTNYIRDFREKAPIDALDRVREAVYAARGNGVDGLPRRVMTASGTAIDGGNIAETLARMALRRSDLPRERIDTAQDVLDRHDILVNLGQNLDLQMEQLSIQEIARRDGVHTGSMLDRARDRFTDRSNRVYDDLAAEFDSWSDAYINMIDKKTVDLYVASVDIGATLAGAGTGRRETLGTAMRHIGRAFQIQDDYLEIEESTDTIGKQPTDITNGKLTLAAISTYETMNGVIDMMERGIDALDAEPVVADYMARSGVGRDAARDMIDRAARGDPAAVHELTCEGVDITTAYADDEDVARYLDAGLLTGKDADEVRQDRERFLATYGNASGQDDIDAVSDIILEYGTAKERARDHIHRAKDVLAGSDLVPEFREKFEGLADYMLERSH